MEPRDRRRRAEQERIDDWGWLLGIVGLGALAFVGGRATAPGNDCCDRLVVRDTELLLLEQRLNVGS